MLKEYRMFTSAIIIVFSAKHWTLFMVKSMHLQFPRAILSGSLHLDSSRGTN